MARVINPEFKYIETRKPNVTDMSESHYGSWNVNLVSGINTYWSLNGSGIVNIASVPKTNTNVFKARH